MAENSAGRSEVTFKAWFNPAEDNRSSDDRSATGVIPDGGNNNAAETKSEVLVGVSLGAAAVALVAASLCVVIAVRRRQPCHRKYAYYVRDNHGGGTTKRASTLAPFSCLRRLTVRGRQLFCVASAVDDPKDDVVGGCDVVDDKLVSSTLQSLLEARQLFDESLPPRTTTDDEDAEKQRLEHDEQLDTSYVDQTKQESDGDRCPCSCTDLETDSEQTGQDGVKESAPDLLPADGHTFRRGGVARSPYRRSKPKVSFADYRSPSSEFTSGNSSSSQLSLTPRRQLVADADDGTDSASSSVLRGHSCCVVDSSPACSSKDERPRTSVGPQRMSVGPQRTSVGPQRTSVGPQRTSVGQVRRSHSSYAVSASKVPPPPMPLFTTTQERLRQTSGAHNELDVDSINIALPATISGFTEGLFPPTKPMRTYQWRSGGECGLRLGPRFSEPTVRRAPRNLPPRTASRGTEV